MVLILYLLALMVGTPAAWAGANGKEARAVEFLRDYVEKLNHPVTIFHWENAGNDLERKYDLTQPAGRESYLREQMNGYLATNAKFGMYFALDPVDSRAFGDGGGSGWRLIQVTLPAGAAYLRLGSERGRDFLAKRLGAVLGDPKCGEKLALGVSQVDLGEDVCSELKRRVFRKLGIQLVRYDWTKNPRLAGLCSGKDLSAFVIAQPGWLRPENFSFYTAESRHDPQNRKAIQELTLSVKRMLPTDRRPLWSDLPNQPGLSDETKKWMRENLENCREENRELPDRQPGFVSSTEESAE